jgi:hypothetical protein
MTGLLKIIYPVLGFVAYVSQVTKVQELVPQAIELLNKLRLQADRIRQVGEDLKANLSRLRSDVSIARNHANLVRNSSLL